MTTGTELMADETTIDGTLIDDAVEGGDLTKDPVPADPAATPWWRDVASWTVLLALLVWAVPFTRAGGGRDPFAQTEALLALVPGLAVVRPWRVLGRLDLLALVPAVFALLACFTAPSGFDGLLGFAAFVYAGVLFLLVRGYVGGARLGGDAGPARNARLGVVVAALVVAGIYQFFAAWWAWYGRGDSSSLLVGTFFWHNQFAVFMAALGIFGAAHAIRGKGWTRWAGAGLAVLAVPSLAFAASRATLALFVLCWIALLLVSVRRPRALVTLLVLPLLGLGVAGVLSSSALMSTPHSVTANLQQREPAAGNAHARLAYDHMALQIVADHPLTGTGAQSFGGVSAPLLPTWLSQPTAFVHDGFLQAFVDGGVPLGVGLLLAALAPLVVGLRRAWGGRLGRSRDVIDAVTLGSLGALGLLAAHSAVDDDWTYPSLLAMYAILAAVLCASRPAEQAPVESASADDSAEDSADDAGSDADSDVATEPKRAPRRLFVPLFAVAIVALLVVAVPASVRGSAAAAPLASVPGWAKVASAGVPLSGGPAWMRGATECDNGLRTELSTAGTKGLQADLDCTAAIGAVSPSVQIERARGFTRLGEVAKGKAMADQLATAYGDRIPQLLILRAALPADAGDPKTALANVKEVAKDPRVVANPLAAQFAESVTVALGGTQ